MQSLQSANDETKVNFNKDDSKVLKCENFNSGAHCSSAVSSSDPSSIEHKKNLFLNYLRERSSKILIKHLVEEEKINMVVLNLKPGEDYSVAVSLSKVEEDNHLGQDQENSEQTQEDDRLLNNHELNACLANGEVKEDAQPLYTRDVLLDYVDKQELPYALIDEWSSKYPQLFYNGCVIVQIRDFRYSKEPQIRYTVLRPHNQSMINDSNLVAGADVGTKTFEDRLLFVESSIVKAAHEKLDLNPSTAVGLRSFRQCISRTALFTNKPLRTVARHSQLLLSKRPKVEETRLGQSAETPSKLLAGLDHEVRTSNRKTPDISQSKTNERPKCKLVKDGRKHDERPNQTIYYNDCKSIEGVRDINSLGSHQNVNKSHSVSTDHQGAHKLVPQQFAVKDTAPLPPANGAVLHDGCSSTTGNTSSSGCVFRSGLNASSHQNHVFPSHSPRTSTVPSLMAVSSTRNAYSLHASQAVSPQPSTSLAVQDLNIIGGYSTVVFQALFCNNRPS